MNKLYMCQWSIADENYHQQYETEDLLKVFNKLELEFKMKIESVKMFKTGVILVVFDYLVVYIGTDMDKLIDCEVLP